MYKNTDPTPPPPPPRKPCIRDMATLLRDHLPPLILKLTPMKEIKRRAAELERTHPQYREELPLVISGEQRRRAIESGQLSVSGDDVEFFQAISTASCA